ncbi:organic cation transporter protein-like [Chelonus insularis]|uniref:organic cation transporter protein-like n=1 Tax=Chelonus insularis TaxID=460826 RepID=UPI00158F0F18|nr:organic cation transporter protein-like [Chelonus insularis]XP_034936794.1 organic cation transporter protein-like [Chelonus insularis]
MDNKETEDAFNLPSSISNTDKKDEQTHLRGIHDIDRIGKYQLMVYFVISFPVILSAAFALGYVFTSGEVGYRCFIPECETSLTSIWNTSWAKYSVPAKNNLFGSCEHYTIKSNHVGVCSEQSFTQEIKKCDHWVYKPDEKTILNEWNITCNENRWKLALVGTINNVGQLVGLMFAGFLSDRYGRRTLLVTETFCTGIVGLIQSFSINYWMFIALEFAQSVSSAGVYSTAYILALEMTGERRRVVSGTIMCCVYAIGEMLVGTAAMGLKSWRNLLRIFFAPCLLAIFLPFVIPESIRWLVANGKRKELENVYRRIAKMNGTKMPDIEINLYKDLNSENTYKETKKATNKNKSVIEALSRPKLLMRLLACCLCWLTNTFVYYGLSLNSVAFAGDKYVNFILVSFVEIPAYFLSGIFIDYLGRKPTLAGSFLFSGIFCLGIQFIPRDAWSYAPIIMYMGGKACITMAFATVYVYTAEMFPTTARHFLLSICSMTGRIGSILAPQTRLLATVIESLPLILFGCMGMLAGIISFLFPETMGQQLPDTIDDAENIGKKSTDKNFIEQNK